MKIFTTLAIALICLFSLGGRGPIEITGSGVPAAGGGGFTAVETYDYDFGVATNIDGWAARNGSAACSYLNGDLKHENSGACTYTGGETEGTQPTTRNQWAIAEYGASAGHNTGFVLRSTVSTTTPIAQVNVAIRCDDTDDFEFRFCTADDICTTWLNPLNDNCPSKTTGDTIGVMIAGETTSVEMCAWFWEAASPPATPEDPDSWGNASDCVFVTGGSISLLAPYSSCGSGTDCAGATAPSAYSDGGEVNIHSYKGSTGTNTWAWIIAGELQ